MPSSWQRSTAERLGKGDMPYPAYSLFINLHFTDMTNTKLHWAKLIDECRFIERVFDAMRIFPGTRSRGPMTRGFSWRALYPTAMRYYLCRFFLHGEHLISIGHSLTPVCFPLKIYDKILLTLQNKQINKHAHTHKHTLLENRGFNEITRTSTSKIFG